MHALGSRVHRSPNMVQYTVYSVQCTVYSAVYSVQCTVYSVPRKGYGAVDEKSAPHPINNHWHGAEQQIHHSHGPSSYHSPSPPSAPGSSSPTLSSPHPLNFLLL